MFGCTIIKSFPCAWFFFSPYIYIFSHSIIYFCYCFIPLAFCCCNGSISSRRSWKFYLNSSRPPLFSLQESAAFLLLCTEPSSSTVPLQRLHPLRSQIITWRRVSAWQSAGFWLEDSMILWGNFFSSVIMEYNKVKCETVAYERAFLSMQRVRIGNASCSSAERANKQFRIEGRRWHVECCVSCEYSCKRFFRLGTS